MILHLSDVTSMLLDDPIFDLKIPVQLKAGHILTALII